MDEKKKTNIIALIDDSQYGASAAHAAASLAVFFKSSLTLVPHFSPSRSTAAMSNINRYDDIRGTYPDLEIICQDENFTQTSLHKYADDTNSIMYVLGVAPKGKSTIFNRKKALKFIKTSRLPVMAVGAETPADTTWKEVFLSIDIHRQEKEKALWAGYFYRFQKSNIHILHNSYRDEFLKQKTIDNLKFVEKLYSNLEIISDTKCVESNIDNLDYHILQNAQQYNPSVLVIMTTKYYSLIDLLFGPKEQRLIANNQNVPILCINERDDLYVLCT